MCNVRVEFWFSIFFGGHLGFSKITYISISQRFLVARSWNLACRTSNCLGLCSAWNFTKVYQISTKSDKYFTRYCDLKKNARPKAARHWRRREAAIEDINHVQYSILLKCTKFEKYRTNIRQDIAILSIATLGLYIYRYLHRQQLIYINIK